MNMLSGSMVEKSNNWSPPEPDRARSSFTKICLRTGLLLLLVAAALFHQPIGQMVCQMSVGYSRPVSIDQRARHILESTPLIDGHIDLPILVQGKFRGKIDNGEWKQSFKNGPFPGHVDIARLRAGLSGGAFWSVYYPCPNNASDFSRDNLASQVQGTYDQIDLMTRILELFPDDFSSSQGFHAQDAMKAFSDGKFISPLGVEGLHQIGNSASNLRRYYAMGVRYSTLTHNCHNIFADAALQEHPLRKATPIFNGVSEAGYKLVNEMNRIGMIVDLAHVSVKTMEDVLGGTPDWQGSKAPVMFSHSSAYAICPHPRNVPDHVLELVRKRNSIVMVNISGGFIACEDAGADNGIPVPIPEDNNLAQVVKHIMYIGNLIGFDHVGIGTDLDGINDAPEGFEDVTKYPDLVRELLRQGVGDDDISKVVGRNILRVWADVEAVASVLQAHGEPAFEDE